MRAAAAAAALVLWCSAVHAQTVSQRGFLEAEGLLFPQSAVNDSTRAIGDVLLREEVFIAPAPWVQFAAGLDLRANSHGQVEDRWRLDVGDRGVRRPRAALRRLTATLTAGPLTVDIGKQFVRWARTDVFNPIDRFAPRDFLNVIDAEFVPVSAIRPSLQRGNHTFEAVWAWRLTPSRMPLLDQRWTILPPEAAGLSIRDGGSRFPARQQGGARWRHAGARVELGLTYFDGFNHLPQIEARPVDTDTIEVTRTFPRLRSYGIDTAIPLPWFTLKGEGAYFATVRETGADYGLYVLEVERQAGEWLLIGGYAGEVGRDPARLAFDPERALAPAFMARASYTVDPRRTVTIEGAVRQNGNGQYVKADFSQALASRWRLTAAGVVLGGDSGDFLGQFQKNSHAAIALRFSF